MSGPAGRREGAGDKYEIGASARPPGTHPVAALGDGFIVLRDPVGVMEMRVPVYSVKAVAVMKSGAK